MLTLGQDDILLDRRADDWRSALDQAATVLGEAGLVTEGYRDGLYAREAQSSTYLGNAIAIPHGTPQSREHVKHTGVRVLQFPQGVDWHDGNRVYVLVTIAAQSDEHLDILRQLTHVLDREGVAEQLAAADSRGEIATLLSRPVVEARLDAQTLCLNLPALDRFELALAAANRLRQLGCVESDFVARVAEQDPMPLGQGLWLVSSQRGVNSLALSLATPKQIINDTAGNTAGDTGSKVSGVFCLAAQGDTHRGLLERLALLLDSSAAATLHAQDASGILARLSGESSQAQTAEVRVLNAHGLHARPAKQLVQVARHQPVPVRVRLADAGASVSAASLTKILGLGARRGQRLVFSAEGEGAENALSQVCAAVSDGLGEEVLPFEKDREPSPIASIGESVVEPLMADQPHHAAAASPGLAIAPVFVMRTPRFDYSENAENASEQQRRLNDAIREGDEQLESLILKAQGGEVADILSMHQEMLADPELHQAALKVISEGRSAEAAWWNTINSAARAQEALEDHLLAERAADLRDIGRRVLGILCGIELPTPPDHSYILVMDDIGPSDVARLDTYRVRGLLTARGGATAHSAILARALGIPAAVGAGEQVLALANGSELILDGERGRITPSPSPERRQRAERYLEERVRRERDAWQLRFEEGRTRDGHRIEVAANLGNTAHARDAVERGAEGIGLLRTEFLFMAYAQAPDLETQIGEYREAIDALDGRPLVARTLDVGGDKPLPYWPVAHEDNPFLGLRGIRLALTQPDVLETQLRALLMASVRRPLRIMLPMVKDILEFRAAKAIFTKLLDKIDETERATDVQLGVMVEIPSCALLAPSLAAEVDFFSIGTNDLTQYTLAIDRGHPQLSAQSDGLHPAVLRLIRMTVEAAHAQDKWVGVCGELASDALAVPVLVGLGVDELSVSARQVPMVKARLREFDLSEARAQAELALSQADSIAVRNALESR